VLQLSYEALQAAYSRLGYPWWTKPYDLNLFGVRAKGYRPDHYDDRLGIAYTDKYGNKLLFEVAATTDPGLYYLNNPMNSRGCAYLKPGYYKGSHCLGTHKGYAAIVQCGPVTVYRIRNSEDTLKLSEMPQDTGIHGINIHRALASGLADTVGKFGAGCQVTPWAEDLNYMRALVAMQRTFVGTDRVSYGLITAEDVALLI